MIPLRTHFVDNLYCDLSIVNVDNEPKPGGGGRLGVQYQHPNSFDKVAVPIGDRDFDDSADDYPAIWMQAKLTIFMIPIEIFLFKFGRLRDYAYSLFSHFMLMLIMLCWWFWGW